MILLTVWLLLAALQFYFELAYVREHGGEWGWRDYLALAVLDALWPLMLILAALVWAYIRTPFPSRRLPSGGWYEP